MPENWKKYKLIDIATLQRGFDLPTSKRIPGNIPIIAASGIGGFHNIAKVKGPGVVTGRSGTIGKVMFEKEDFWPLNTSLWVKDFHGNDPMFIYYLLTNFDFSSFNNGTSVPTLNRNDVHTVDFTIPPLQEQKSIAQILSALDDKIALNLQTNQTLEEMAMALYKHWFVDFGPFQNGEFVDSELGKIPKGWKVKTIGELVNDKVIAAPKDGNHGGIHPKGKDFIESGVPFITASDLKSGNIDFEKWSHISFKQAKTLKKGFSVEGDVLLSHKATIGRVCIVPKLKTDFIILTPQVTYYRILNRLELSSEFLQYTFKSNMFQNNLNTRAQSGSTRAYLSITNQWDLIVIMPMKNVIQEYTVEVENLTELQSVNRAENQTLTTLRDILLPKLISGEVRVKDIEKTIAEAL